MHSSLTKIFVYVLFFFVLLSNLKVYSSNQKNFYSGKSISNYFSGLISSNNNNNSLAIKYLNDLKYLKNSHDQFNQKLTFALVQTGNISEVFKYLKKLEKHNINFFNANLLLGINYVLEKNYEKSINHFNSIIEKKKFYDLEKLIAQSLLYYIQLFENQSFNYKNALNNIPGNYKNFTLIHEAFLNCYLDNEKVEESFLRLINPKTLDFTRYNFFYANFLLSKNRENTAIKILEKKHDVLNTNLLLDQTTLWLREGKTNRANEIFNCKNPKHLISEFFYLIANLYSSEKNYKISNFYLKLSLYLNSDFIFNNVLLAENYFYLKDYMNSKIIYSKFNSKNSIYNWHAKKRIVLIKIKTENDESAINFLNKSFKKLKNPKIGHYYDLANFYKDFEKYNESIKYYTKVLKEVSKEHPLYPEILYRRGMSYERLKLWKKSDDDLIHSLNLAPEEPYVLNYLAYSWLERNININKSIEMLEKAISKKKKDPYIIDSLGWGMYLIGRYNEAEIFLQRAVELMPRDPIVNDHYGDILWKLNQNLQANYFWNYVLNLENTEDQMKDKIKKKLIFGIPDNS